MVTLSLYFSWQSREQKQSFWFCWTRLYTVQRYQKCPQIVRKAGSPAHSRGWCSKGNGGKMRLSAFCLFSWDRLSSLRTFGAQREEVLRGENKPEWEGGEFKDQFPLRRGASSNCVCLLCLHDRILKPEFREVCLEDASVRAYEWRQQPTPNFSSSTLQKAVSLCSQRTAELCFIACGSWGLASSSLLSCVLSGSGDSIDISIGLIKEGKVHRRWQGTDDPTWLGYNLPSR